MIWLNNITGGRGSQSLRGNSSPPRNPFDVSTSHHTADQCNAARIFPRWRNSIRVFWSSEVKYLRSDQRSMKTVAKFWRRKYRSTIQNNLIFTPEFPFKIRNCGTPNGRKWKIEAQMWESRNHCQAYNIRQKKPVNSRSSRCFQQFVCIHKEGPFYKSAYTLRWGTVNSSTRPRLKREISKSFLSSLTKTWPLPMTFINKENL